jgi:hypothetical protein
MGARPSRRLFGRLVRMTGRLGRGAAARGLRAIGAPMRGSYRLARLYQRTPTHGAAPARQLSLWHRWPAPLRGTLCCIGCNKIAAMSVRCNKERPRRAIDRRSDRPYGTRYPSIPPGLEGARIRNVSPRYPAGRFLFPRANYLGRFASLGSLNTPTRRPDIALLTSEDAIDGDRK